ncbi:MAG: efflux RND transporter periplasmic adaptor subunit [Alphaproteobacteria bacterium]
MKLQLQLIIVIALAAVLGAGWFWLGGAPEANGARDGKSRRGAATRVVVEPVTLAEDRVVVRAIGTATAQNSAALHPSVDGEVVDVRFKADQRVEKGTVLLRLDDEHQRLAVRLAEVALAKAKRDVTRLRRLAKSGHASRISLDTAQTDLETAQVRVAQAKAELADRVVLAPFSGVIGLSDISVGDRVTTDTMIATLDERSTLLVDFNLQEDYANRVRVGDRIEVRPSTSPGTRIEGLIAAVDSRIEQASRTLKIRAQIPNPEDFLRPGTSFAVALLFKGNTYPIVREISVLWSRDGAYLWRAADGRAEKVFVKLVRRDRGRILIEGDIGAGDLVVVEGVQGLRAGQRLKPEVVAAPETADRGTGRK